MKSRHIVIPYLGKWKCIYPAQDTAGYIYTLPEGGHRGPKSGVFGMIPEHKPQFALFKLQTKMWPMTTASHSFQ